MKRRTVLSALGGGLVPIAGCLDLSAPSNESPSPSTKTPAYDPEGRFRTVRIGDRTGDIISHRVGVWNAAGTSRGIHVTVVDATAGTTRHDRTHEVPGDTVLAVELRAPARYRITLRVPSVDLERSFEVPRSFFDTCNDSFSHVSVRQTDRITVRTLSTELACLTETP